MRKSRFTEAQIIGMIKKQGTGMQTAEVCRKYGLGQGTFREPEIWPIHPSLDRALTRKASWHANEQSVERLW